MNIMKKTFTFILFLLLLSNLYAYEIPANEALNNALSVLGNNSQKFKAKSKSSTYSLVTDYKESGQLLYYVFEEKNGGFLIVGSDTQLPTVIGYAEEGTLSDALAIPAFNWWMECSKLSLYDILTQPKRKTSERISIASEKAKMELPNHVDPLLGNIKWDQMSPFNNQCPVYYEQRLCATGCVATGMGQLMMYYKWPKKGTGSHSYITDTYGFKVSADFSLSTYDWDNMLEDYSQGYNATQAKAVSKLLSDIGVACDMDYGLSSGAIESDAMRALATYFGYSKDSKYLYRANYSSDEWNTIVKSELAEGRPVPLSGTNYLDNAGHFFIVDGYNNIDLFHVNWGWSGMSNGYFNMKLMNPEAQGIGGSTGGYCGDMRCITNLYPDKEGVTEAKYLLSVLKCLQYNTEEAKNKFTYTCCNSGLGEYNGKIGFLAEVDGTAVGQFFFTIKNFAFCKAYSLSCDCNNLGITKDKLGSKTATVTPVYVDENGDYIPMRGPISSPQQLYVSYQNGELVLDAQSNSRSNLEVKNFQLASEVYPSYPIHFDVQIKNKPGSKEYNNAICVYILDKNEKTVDVAADTKIIEQGETITYDLYTTNKLEPGTYYAYLTYEPGNGYREYFDLKPIMFTVAKDPEPAMLTYKNFKFFDSVVEQGQEVAVSFDVYNSGGYTEHKYSLYFFPLVNGVVNTVGNLPSSVVRIPNGKTLSVNMHGKVNLEPGKYFCSFCDDYNGQYIGNQFKFTVQEATGLHDMKSWAETSTYDLNGKLLDNETNYKRGIYIKGGKKYTK